VVDEPRWLVDEMLGRLARYLRFLGYDTEYVRGDTDEAIALRARTEGRRLITRDRHLSSRSPGAVLLTHTDLAAQMRELVEKVPSLRREVRFDRCSLCNGPLVPIQGSLPGSRTPNPSVAMFQCSACGHRYWEGSHTRSVRARLSIWLPSER
jgi:uncharacterized protein